MISKSLWRPSASINTLYKRSFIISKIRTFFKKLKIIEVDTPMMSQTSTTDIYSMPFKTYFISSNKKNNSTDYWLTTSPEYHMKRLLAAGSGPIYQICHSFRNNELGSYHNPEFTLLEWYRPFFNMYELMQEVNSLLKLILKCDNAELSSYQELFIKHLNIDPLSTNKNKLRKLAKNFKEASIVIQQEENVNIILQILFMFGIEPYIGKNKPIFVYHFPSSQASLAKINSQDLRIAERFEIYYKGIELGNGFDELTDSEEQKKRFENDNYYRIKNGLPNIPIDKNLLDALNYGLPNCSGVAIGIDRLVMLALNKNSLNEVMSFPINRS